MCWVLLFTHDQESLIISTDSTLGSGACLLDKKCYSDGRTLSITLQKMLFYIIPAAILLGVSTEPSTATSHLWNTHRYFLRFAIATNQVYIY